MSDGLDAGLTINESKEVLVHLYAYCGFPRSLNAINTLEVVVNERKQNGLKDVTGKEAGKPGKGKSKFEFGKEVQTKLTRPRVNLSHLLASDAIEYNAASFIAA